MAEFTVEELTALLAAVRIELDISWEDENLDSKLTRFLKSGKIYIDNKTGAEQDYTVEEEAQSLLFNYVRYCRSGALEMFWPNYRHELMALRLESGVTAYEAEELAEESDV